MGAAGRPGKPTALRMLHGERKDRINPDEAKASAERPEIPSGMDPEVMEVWDYTVRQLSEMGLASQADRDTLAAYCAAVVTHRKATRSVLRDGILIEGAMGGKVRNPSCAVQREAAAVIKSLGAAFGLTPSSRSSIRVGAAKARQPRQDDPSRLLTGKKTS